MSFTMVFPQGKPCCKNNANKGKVSCKFNQANIDIKNNGDVMDEGVQTTENANVQGQNSANVNSAKCSGCKKSAKWWKFWAKKKSCCNTKV